MAHYQFDDPQVWHAYRFDDRKVFVSRAWFFTTLFFSIVGVLAVIAVILVS